MKRSIFEPIVSVSLAFVFSVVAACSSSSATSPPPPPAADASADEDAGGGGGGGQCTAARETALGPVAKVAAGAVSLVRDMGGVRTIYVDASAGGAQMASRNPRVYVDLSTGAKVEISDPEAFTSTVWDLALKRSVLYTNSGDAGPGGGGAAVVRKSFADVTAADADGVTPKPESFFDEECTEKKDDAGYTMTTFFDWYSYDEATHVPTPRDQTYIVKGASGKRFKLSIASYTATPDGGTNNRATGHFLLEVADL